MSDLPPLPPDMPPPAVRPPQSGGAESPASVGGALRSMWLHPRATVRAILAEDPNRLVMTLACLAGIDQVLSSASSRNLGDDVPLWTILVIAVVLGPLDGLLTLWIGSHLMLWAGRWIGGRASRGHLRTAMAWAWVPSLPALVLWAMQIAGFGSAMFTKDTPQLEGRLLASLVFALMGVGQAVFAIWSIVLMANAVAEVQGFRSGWKGLGNFVLAGLVVLAPITVIVLLVTLVASLGRS